MRDAFIFFGLLLAAASAAPGGPVLDVFAPDPDDPTGPPLLYISNGRKRIFVLQAIPPRGTVVSFR